MRVIIDTNVIISAVVFRSEKINDIIEYIADVHELLLPSYVLNEVRRVVANKFPSRHMDIEMFFVETPFVYVQTPQQIPSDLFEIRDEADAPILYTAILENVDVLVTGDKDFHAVEIDRPEIMNIIQFAEKYVLGQESWDG